LRPTKIYEDNQGVIKQMESGMSPKQRTSIRICDFFFVRDRMKKEEVVMVYMMIADIMTKPLTGILFEQLGSELTCNVSQRAQGAE
jgi:hypothetical protein